MWLRYVKIPHGPSILGGSPTWNWLKKPVNSRDLRAPVEPARRAPSRMEDGQHKLRMCLPKAALAPGISMIPE